MGNKQNDENGTPVGHRDPADVLPSDGIGIVVIDHRLQVVHRNAAAGRFFGPANSAFELFDSADTQNGRGELADEIQKVIVTGTATCLDGVTCRLGPKHRRVTLMCEPLVLSADQGPSGCIVVAREADRQERQRPTGSDTDQMAAIGVLTSRVAHELNNLLDGILRYINLAIGSPNSTADAKVQNYLEESKGGLIRMIRITRELLEFSRTKPATPQHTNIREIVADATKLLQSPARQHGVEIVMDVPELPLAEPGSAQLFQVFCNLIKNAIEAMPGGGTLHIAAERVGDELAITFEDTGSGLPGNNEQVFEPFFTTRTPGQGTGLGLAICRDLVQRCCGGTITAANRLPRGARFEIRLPITRRHAAGDQLVRQ